MSGRWARIGSLSGVLFVLLVIASNVVGGGYPENTERPSEGHRLLHRPQDRPAVERVPDGGWCGCRAVLLRHLAGLPATRRGGRRSHGDRLRWDGAARCCRVHHRGTAMVAGRGARPADPRRGAGPERPGQGQPRHRLLHGRPGDDDAVLRHGHAADSASPSLVRLGQYRAGGPGARWAAGLPRLHRDSPWVIVVSVLLYRHFDDPQPTTI